MRSYEFIAETLTSKVSNPGGVWLAAKQEDCRDSGVTAFGAPKYFGPVTAHFSDYVLIKTADVSAVSGLRGEQSSVNEETLHYLIDYMKKSNKFPLANDGHQYFPFMMVDYTGRPWVSEGNHRIMAAHALNWEYIPVEVKFFSGGEEHAGRFSIDSLLAGHARALSAGFSDGDLYRGDPTKFVEEGKNTRTREFIREMHDWHNVAAPGLKSLTNIGQYYDIYRFGLVMASMGRDEDPMKGDTHGDSEDNPTTLSYTDAEEKIITDALKKMGASYKQLTGRASAEPKDTYTVSPMPPRGPIKRRS